MEAIPRRGSTLDRSRRHAHQRPQAAPWRAAVAVEQTRIRASRDWRIGGSIPIEAGDHRLGASWDGASAYASPACRGPGYGQFADSSVTVVLSGSLRGY